jgi:hypothetical protein
MKTEDIKLRLADKSLTWDQRKALVHELVERTKEDIDKDPTLSDDTKEKFKKLLDADEKAFIAGTLGHDFARGFAAKMGIHRDSLYGDDRYAGQS